MSEDVSKVAVGLGAAVAIPLAIVFQVAGFVVLGFVFGWFPMIALGIVQSRTGLPVGLDYVSSSLVLSLVSFSALLGSRLSLYRRK